MRRTLLLLTLLIMTTASTMAGPVSKTQALQTAQSFLQQRGKSLSTSPSLRYKAPRNGQTTTAEEAAYYVFNVGNDNGFVIISGDDRTEAILGYSDKGTFDEQNIPANMLSWLQSYAEQMEMLDRAGVTTTARRAPKKTAAYRNIAPMVTAHWNQDEPFNNSCPLFPNTTDRCVTGCVATAMAQVIYTHREQSKNNGFYYLSKDIEGYSTSRFGIEVETFPANDSYLDWDNMLDSYSGNETDEEIAAVANLMAYCGASVGMDYGINANGGSGAPSSMVAYAMKQYFGYDDGTQTVYRTRYTIDEWDNLIYNELKEGRPVAYGGKSGSGTGHAFVIDGYDVDGYFHINWGWGGLSDGYYLLSVCEPPTSGIGGAASGNGYSIDQVATIGAQPDTGVEAPVNPTLDAIDPVVDGNQITFNIINHSGKDNFYNCGIGYLDANGMPQLLQKWGYSASLLEDQDYFHEIKYTLTPEDFARAGLGTGTYNIIPMCQVGDEGDWMKCNMRTAVIEATYNAEAGTLALVIHEPTVNLAASDFQFTGNLFVAMTQPFSMTVTNNGDEYNGILYCFASKDGSPGSVSGRTGIAVAKNGSISVNMSFQPSAPGDYTIWIATDEYCSNIIGQTNVTITSTEPQRTLVLKETNAEYAHIAPGYTGLYHLMGNHMSGVIKIQNQGYETYTGKLDVMLYDQTNGVGEVETHSTKVSIQPGEVIDLPIDFKNLAYGDEHFLVLFYDDYYKFGESDIFIAQPAVMTTLADGTVTATEPETVTEINPDAVVVDITGAEDQIENFAFDYDNQNPNTLFIMGADAPEYGSLWERNVVKGNTAEEITITDGYPFLVPNAINVGLVNYTRTFDIGTDAQGSGWQTIVLPFSPESIYAESYGEIDWFHSRNDENKDFWLMEFTKTIGSKVYFDYAESFDANIPYIIAVPDDTWGDDFDLRGKEITFSAQNTTMLPASRQVVSSDVFQFVGIMRSLENAQAYGLNDEGSKFEIGNSSQQPFHAYFEAKDSHASLPQALSVGFVSDDSSTTSITLPTDVNGHADIYTLSGVRIATLPVSFGRIDLSSLPQGVYIVNGKKIIK